MLQLKPDKEAFERVCKELEEGKQLNVRDIVDVFGWEAMELFLLCTPESKRITDLLKDIKKRL